MTAPIDALTLAVIEAGLRQVCNEMDLAFVRAAFSRVGIEDWQSRVRVDDSLLRSGDAPQQLGDASHARESLDWAPTVGFEEIVNAMVDADLAIAADAA